MSADQNNLPEQCCRHCHFLSRLQYASPLRDPGAPKHLWTRLSSEIDDDQRDKAASEPRFNTYNLGCFKEVWEYKDGFKVNVNNIVTQDRGETCFFYEWVPGMSCEAAAELERRETSRREAQRDRELTRAALQKTDLALAQAQKKLSFTFVALIVGIVTLLVSTLINGTDLYFKWFHQAVASHKPATSDTSVPSPSPPKLPVPTNADQPPSPLTPPLTSP